MGKPSAPPAPNYTAAAQAQGAANLTAAQQQALLNNPNMQTPYGNQTYTPGTPTTDAQGNTIMGRPTLTQTLSPNEQAILQGGEQAKTSALGILNQDMPNISNALQGPFNYTGANIVQGGFDPRYAPTQGMQYGPGNSAPIQGSVQPGQNFIPSVEQAQYAQGAMFLDPQFKQAQSDLSTQLSNQGITPGSDAYNRAQNNLALQKTGAYQNLINNAITTGQGAAQGIFGMNLASGQFGNAAQQQQYQELLNSMQARNAAVTGQAQIASNATALSNAAQQQGYSQYVTNRTMPINMLNSLLSSSQVQNPTFQATQPTAITPAPILQGAGLQGQANAAGASANAGKFGSGLGALGQIGAAAISDRRLKSNVRKIGKIGRFNWYEFDLFGERQQGVMADEVEAILPQAVVTGADGYKRVYYSMLRM